MIPLVLGAALAGIFSILGGTLQSGREHDRWIRQSRMEAYTEFLIALDAWDSASTTDRIRMLVERPHDVDKYKSVVSDAERRFGAAVSRVYLLGPDVVRQAAGRCHGLALDRAVAFEQLSEPNDLVNFDVDDADAQAQARGVLLALMNRAIGIGPRSQFGRRFRRVE
ncbi:hypothetical protein FVA74_05960 [Salinibacterium sp. dk2585]|uniref:hypothetical protein n=1 Tax=unclassified Salinibacterium TaxID=2632331 RepID=UPI0011C257E8|nr:MULTISPECIES: hypothetical protein [unclassified Salinibacterium]QEE61170.1 hypothetical protein FVA74_05960 [Salinibacterium sp. dk2585]TXK53845.1 hypothetical protein FVP63_07410 [Salinibacterium sp. dk5596]